jgi:hypothetical protein
MKPSDDIVISATTAAMGSFRSIGRRTPLTLRTPGYASHLHLTCRDL